MRLKGQHPETLDEAKEHEKPAAEHASLFICSQGEALEDL